MDEEKCDRLVKVVQDEVGPGTGFIIFTFDFGARGAMTYAANCERHDGLTALAEFLAGQDPALMAGVVQRVMKQFASGPELADPVN